VLFSDQTYSAVSLNYLLQPSGSPLNLELVGAPAADMVIGGTAQLRAQAMLADGPIDVTNVATYASESGTSAVFSLSPGGILTAAGAGADWLNVSYNGVTVPVPITVGSCTYSLSPANQIIQWAGGIATIQVRTSRGAPGQRLAAIPGWRSRARVEVAME
jgi:hypothetical protein